MRDITQVIIHCSFTKTSQDIGEDEITDWHVNGNGWSNIGYHFVIRRNGTVERGRDWQYAGVHTRGHNANSIGVCIVGGMNDEGRPEVNYTSEQWVTLRNLVEFLTLMFPDATVHGHNEFSDKECPCFYVPHWWTNKVS